MLNTALASEEACDILIAFINNTSKTISKDAQQFFEDKALDDRYTYHYFNDYDKGFFDTFCLAIYYYKQNKMDEFKSAVDSMRHLLSCNVRGSAPRAPLYSATQQNPMSIPEQLAKWRTQLNSKTDLSTMFSYKIPTEKQLKKIRYQHKLKKVRYPHIFADNGILVIPKIGEPYVAVRSVVGSNTAVLCKITLTDRKNQLLTQIALLNCFVSAYENVLKNSQ